VRAFRLWLACCFDESSVEFLALALFCCSIGSRRDHFDPGVGEVKELNQSLPGYYSGMASMVNKIRQHKALLAKEYRRWIFEEMKRKNIGLCSRSEPGNMTIIASNNQCEFLL